MPLARINGRLLHFIHIPKTGGSSVNTYLRSRGSLALYSRNPLDWMDVSPQHLHQQAAQAVIPNGFCDKTFAILRNPVSRIISEYRYRAARWREANGPSERALVEWHDGGTFEGDFNEWLARVLKDWGDDPHLYDNHIRQQSDYWTPGITTFIFENGLDRVFDWIDDSCGIPRGERIHENPGARVAVTMSKATERAIRDFYRVDANLIRRVKQAGVEKTAPGPEIRSAPADAGVKRALERLAE